MNSFRVDWKQPGLVETLAEMWGSGQTSPQIAAALGMTRNQVIGAVSRMGMERWPDGVRPRGEVLPTAGGPRREHVVSKAIRPPRAERVVRAVEPEPSASESKPAISLAPIAGAAEPVVAAPIEPVSTGRPMVGRFTIMDLRLRSCRWIDGQPAGAQTLFCGAETVSETCSYCHAHQARSVSAVQPGRAR